MSKASMKVQPSTCTIGCGSSQEQAKVNTLTGEAIIHLLSLQTAEYGRVNTSIGTKTAVGLALTIERIIKDHGFAKSIVRGEV